MDAQQAQNKNEVLEENLEMSDISQLQGSEDSQDDSKGLAERDELQQESKQDAAANLAKVDAQLKLL